MRGHDPRQCYAIVDNSGNIKHKLNRKGQPTERTVSCVYTCFINAMTQYNIQVEADPDNTSLVLYKDHTVLKGSLYNKEDK